MKLPETFDPSRPRLKQRKERRKGVALVTVLTVMALTTILVLTFFSLASSEHRASNVYSQGLQAQQVGEQAVNFVIAQIREATVQTGGEVRAWASQPGAIRTWYSNGQESDAFKLYSDDVMKTGRWEDFKADFDDLAGWSLKPEHFVDLNEPVIRGEKVYYPIVHPAAAILPKWPKPLGDDKDGVEGFRYNEDSLKLGDEGPVGGKAAGIIKTSHVAMPVKWIYQLADGTFGVLAGDRFSPISGGGNPSAENPIVARFAFWADDETSKLNINTHAGGLAWDVPKAGGDLDMSMGKYQPAQKEWQRYPGHPATTHLSPALAPGVLDIVMDRDAMEMLYKVVPRVVGGGSESGTRVINTHKKEEMNGLIADTEPLFPSLDDVIMRADRTPHEFPDAKGRAIPPEELSEYLERAKFFVTVSSRAPETNLFNKPRIAIWPIAQTSNPNEYQQKLTPFDQLIHFCSSMGKGGAAGYPRYEYIFKREKADSSSHDYQEIPRNRELYGYLREELFGKTIPGYGKSFEGKYGADGAAQLATLLFDYIRSTNLHDDTLYRDFTEAFQRENTSNHYTYTNPRDFNEKGFGHKGHGQVTPIRIRAGSFETKGMGRFYTLSGAHIHAICAAMPGTGDFVFPGVMQYNRNGAVEAPTGTLYPNLPPMPPGIDKSSETNWPQWLKDLKTGNPNEFEAAFDEKQWNWQLAFLDSGYRSKVLEDPNAAKFNRGALTPGFFTDGTTRLQPDERLVQASFLFDLFCPSIGWGSINPDMEIHIKRESGMTFAGADGVEGFLGFEGRGYLQKHGGGDDETFIWATNWSKPNRQGGGRSWGGLLSFGYTLSAHQGAQTADGRNVWWQMTKDSNRNNWDLLNRGIRCRLTPLDRGYEGNRIENALNAVTRKVTGNSPADIQQAYRYDLVTVPFKVGGGGAGSPQLSFSGGTVNFKFFNGGVHCENSAPDSTVELIQEIEVEFPSFSVTAPVLSPGFTGYINEFNQLSHDSHNAVELASLTADPGNPISGQSSKATRRSGTGRSPLVEAWDNRGRMAMVVNHWDSGSTYVRPGDVVQSIGIPHGDVRIAASMPTILPADEVFKEHRKYGADMMAHSMTTSAGIAISGYQTDNSDNKAYLIIPDLEEKMKPHKPSTTVAPYRGAIPLAFTGAPGKEGYKSENVQKYGDFDNGSGLMVDGPYINKPDEGNVHSLRTRFTQEIVDFWDQRRNYGEYPYFSSVDLAEAGGPAYFSPNRIVSGPGMFGSLPTGLKESPPKPWQTLLFRPNVVGNGYSTHPGAESPPDHLIMDFFWMPVVEPYAISEPLSTAGKINMNFEIVPFLHVHRETALRGVFRSEFMLCIPAMWHHSYKHDYGRGQGYHWRDNPYGGALQGKRLRAAIVEADTLRQFTKQRFKEGRGVFKSATEICEIHLVPEEASRRLGQTTGSIGTYTPEVTKDGRVPNMENGKYWRDHSLVGDNSRERPYTNIQARLTTKSNTFQVHYRAQVLKQGRRDADADYGTWRPEIDTVQAEYRGSSIVERYVDPNGEMEDFTNPSAKSIDEYYRFRVINPRRFAP